MAQTNEITIRHLGPDDLHFLLAIRDGLFDHPIDPHQAKAFLTDPAHEIVLAMADQTAVGMATGSVLLHPDKAPAMFIAEVGVRDDWRRKGIGRKVTQALIDIARQRGCKGIWLGTEAENAPALALYRSMDGDEVTGSFFGWDGALEN